jgi:hypothetical protein
MRALVLDRLQWPGLRVLHRGDSPPPSPAIYIMYDASDPPDTALARPCGLVGPPGVLTSLGRDLSRPRRRGGFG